MKIQNYEYDIITQPGVVLIGTRHVVGQKVQVVDEIDIAHVAQREEVDNKRHQHGQKGQQREDCVENERTEQTVALAAHPPRLVGHLFGTAAAHDKAIAANWARCFGAFVVVAGRAASVS